MVTSPYRYILTIFLLFMFSLNTAAQKPEQVYRIIYQQNSNEWYRQQSILWQQEIEKDRSNAAAWMNYYYANRYANFKDWGFGSRIYCLKLFDVFFSCPFG